MKKISTLFLIILCICLAVVLVSCGEHTHDFSADDGTVIIEPTCMYEGKLVRTCECGKTKVEVINKLSHEFSDTISFDNAYHYYACTADKCTATKELEEHNWVKNSKTSVEATCNSLGKIGYKCSCGATKTENVPMIREHVWDNGVDTPATCIATGVKTFTCTICSEKRTEELPLVPHEFETVYTVTETHHYLACKTAGCEEIKEESYEEHIWDEGEVTVEPTCMTLGEKTFTCTVCGESKTEELEALPHNFSDDYHNNASYHYNYCLNEGCTATNNQDHKWGSGVVTREPSAELDGIRTYTCSDCGRTKTEAILYHAYSSWTYDETKHYKKCTEEGHTDITAEGAHVFGEGVITVYPTPTTFGEIAYTCECGYRIVSPCYYEIAPVGTLNPSDWNAAFAEGAFDNVLLEGKLYIDSTNYFECIVVLAGEWSYVLAYGNDELTEAYYYDGETEDYIYTYDEENEVWVESVSDLAYASSFFYPIFNAEGKFFDFYFDKDEMTYTANDLILDGASYDEITYSFEGGVVANVSASLSESLLFLGEEFVAFEFMVWEFPETEFVYPVE